MSKLRGMGMGLSGVGGGQRGFGRRGLESIALGLQKHLFNTFKVRIGL